MAPSTPLPLLLAVGRYTAPGMLLPGEWIEIGFAPLLLLAIGSFLIYRRYGRSALLARRETQFHELLESTPDGLVLLDRAGRIVLVNAHSERMFDYRREELPGQSVAVLGLTPEWDDSRAMEAAARRRGGAEFPVVLTCGRVMGYPRLRALTIRDLTGAKQMEQIVKTAEGLYAAMCKDRNDATLLLYPIDQGSPGKFIQANGAACRWLGYTREALFERSIRDIRAGELLPERESTPFESEYRTRNGKSIPVEVSLRSIEQDGQRAVLEVAWDITERKKAQAELNEQASRRPRPAPPAAPQRQTVPGELRQARILVAEDQEANRNVLLAILQDLGYRGDAVANGSEAVTALEARPYDLVLMDCQMPEMDGYEATRAIRAPNTLVVNPRIPIVALTANSMPEDREICLDAGMDDHIAKPIEPEVLAQTLDKWLSRVQTPAARAQPAIARTEETVFDRDALLKRTMGNSRLAAKVVQSFLDTAPFQLSNLRQQLAAQDRPAASREAHTLKGAAATISAPALRGLALEAEQAATAGEWTRIGDLLPQMEGELERLRRAVAAYQ
jgi:PAS domain S-box-containing protein